MPIAPPLTPTWRRRRGASFRRKRPRCRRVTAAQECADPRLSAVRRCRTGERSPRDELKSLGTVGVVGTGTMVTGRSSWVRSRFYGAGMALRLQAVTFEVADVSVVAAFWAELLDRQVLTEPGGALLPGDQRQVGLRFVTSDTEQLGPRRLHLHLTSNRPEDQQRTVETALRLGGRHLDVGQEPDADYVVLADPDGNAFCVIGPVGRATGRTQTRTEPATLLSGDH